MPQHHLVVDVLMVGDNYHRIGCADRLRRQRHRAHFAIEVAGPQPRYVRIVVTYPRQTSLKQPD
jgi:hypothetical protein